ncbi:MAG TPA: hypothetical protein VKE50_06635 [Thermoanaerobaculia bacterium]|nr:hypothetical protein [Thermoanaerobaculia bacterium]
MKRRLPLLALAFALPANASAAAPMPAPTYCVEWIRQSTEGFERLTLFSDRTLVWKTRHGEQEDWKRKTLEAEEAKFYCDYFAGPSLWSLPSDQRSHVHGEFVTESLARLARPDGSIHEVRFDELAALSPDAAALRASLDGLKRFFTDPLAPASQFTPETLQPGTVLKRFDGTVFRVRMLDEGRGVVELEGVDEPFSQFRRISDLRFFFQAPGPASDASSR